MYTTLYNAVTDALEDLADADYAGAAERLRRAQRETAQEVCSPVPDGSNQ